MSLGGSLPGMSPRTGQGLPEEMTEDIMDEMSEVSEFNLTGGCASCGAPMAPGEGVELEPGEQVCDACSVEGGEGRCEYCEAHPGESHGRGCPNKEMDEPDPDHWHDSRVDREMDVHVEGVNESTEFDKFMDRIVVDERKKQVIDREEDNPQRRRASRYQDRPMNKTRFGSK